MLLFKLVTELFSNVAGAFVKRQAVQKLWKGLLSQRVGFNGQQCTLVPHSGSAAVRLTWSHRANAAALCNKNKPLSL